MDEVGNRAGEKSFALSAGLGTAAVTAGNGAAEESFAVSGADGS
jgi:hypothetical protein